MASRTKRLAVDRGRYYRNIGWIYNANDKRVHKKFLLGKDERVASIAVTKLEQLWEIVERGAIEAGIEAYWTEEDLEVADSVRKGLSVHRVKPDPRPSYGIDINIRAAAYARKVSSLRDRFGHIIAMEAEATQFLMAGQGFFKDQIRRAQHDVQDAARIADVPVLDLTGQNLYAAIDAYAAWALETKNQPTASKEASSAQALKGCTDDLPLGLLDYNRLEAMATYWRKRPPSRARGSRGEPIAVSTVVGRVKTLRRFVRWLHRNSQFNWRMPEDAADAMKLDERRLLTEREISALKDGPATYSVRELATLYRYATDAERFLLLLGVNCAFAQAECVTLRHDEVDVEADPPRIRRVRRKSQRYGEVALWPETIRALEWWVGQQSSRTEFVLVTARGKRFTSQDIANRWNKLSKRVLADHPDFRSLSFKYLRKTAGQFVRDVSDGETAGVFQSRGRVNSDEFSDVYTRRDFGKVFRANAQVRNLLQPMFDAAPHAFLQPRAKGSPNISRAKIEKIMRLWHDGVRPSEIARLTRVGRTTVYRYRPVPVSDT